MSREVPEWIGKDDSSRVPARVRLRVFERYDGRCYLSGRLIRAGEAWDVDHVVSLINGGANRESNLAPALKKSHRAKTAKDVAEKATVYRKKSKHLGIAKKKRKMPYRKFNGDPVW